MLSPADLFIENWDHGRKWSGPEVQNFVIPCAEFEVSVQESLHLPDGAESYKALLNLQKGESNKIQNGRIFAILRAIDSFFETIHPRTLSRAKLLGKLPLNHWLRKLVYARAEQGVFCCTQMHQLVPRGPLLRSAREDFASSGYSFPDQFAFLSVVTRQMSIDERPIQVCTRVIDRSLSQGAGLAPGSQGSERVAFIPVAQLDEHLIVTQTESNGCAYIDFNLPEGLDAATIIDNVLDEIGYADIVMSGELMVDSAAADRLEKLVAAKPVRTRLLMAGSGNSVETQDDLPWNEARVLNGLGVELWRQKKIWQAGLDITRAKDLGLTPGPTGLLMEKNHAGSEVVVADIDSLGRCIILICQDIQSNPLASDLLRNYQPDWVFVPIMDWGTATERWAHQRAYELSAISQARFLIASSLSMVEKLKKSEQPCGLAVGPRVGLDEDEGRVCEPAFVKSTPHGYGLVEWRSTWGKTSLAYRANVQKESDKKATH
ncbi:MAG TPA: hypothetical protein VJS90_18420 [Pseudomonas sp.]|uniref:hypothetical protein n=1 Tax=Pseudomonas sp. TaxID=306 RepID=UPI002B46F30B|nr:hypothetical protein [Pseudomonas sp.]HKS15010.1 hypothetical protein [Pseudomonas sp.]